MPEETTDPVMAERLRCEQLLALAVVVGGGARIEAARRAIENGDSIEAFKQKLVDAGHNLTSHFNADGAA